VPAAGPAPHEAQGHPLPLRDGAAGAYRLTDLLFVASGGSSSVSDPSGRHLGPAGGRRRGPRQGAMAPTAEAFKLKGEYTPFFFFVCVCVWSVLPQQSSSLFYGSAYCCSQCSTVQHGMVHYDAVQ